MLNSGTVALTATSSKTTCGVFAAISARETPAPSRTLISVIKSFSKSRKALSAASARIFRTSMLLITTWACSARDHEPAKDGRRACIDGQTCRSSYRCNGTRGNSSDIATWGRRSVLRTSADQTRPRITGGCSPCCVHECEQRSQRMVTLTTLRVGSDAPIGTADFFRHFGQTAGNVHEASSLTTPSVSRSSWSNCPRVSGD